MGPQDRKKIGEDLEGDRLLQTKTLRATVFFKSASSCC